MEDLKLHALHDRMGYIHIYIYIHITTKNLSDIWICHIHLGGHK